MKPTRTHKQIIANRIAVYLSFLIIIGLMVGQTLASWSLGKTITQTDDRLTQMREDESEYQATHCTAKQEVQQGTTTDYTIQSAGYARTYRVHIPASYRPSEKTPLIINYDGIHGGGKKMELYSSMDTLPVIAVYPDSMPGKSGFTAWQGAPYSLDGNYDIEFTKDMIHEITTRYCVDTERIFAVGMSNGGGFVMIASCELPGVFRAVASLSGAYYTKCTTPLERPSSLLALHSMTDKQVPFLGSPTKGVPPIKEWALQQASDRGCLQRKETHNVYGSEQLDWSKCIDNTQVRLVVIQGQSHGWLTIPRAKAVVAPTMANYIWSFFKETS